jgi:hypothetical protein
MSNQATKPPGPGFGAGHTGQYITLAEGLRQAAEAMEADLAYLEKKGLTTSLASLRFEARCATITVLAAALCECMANTVLATVLAPADFQEVEKEQMPRKWSREVPKALNCAPPGDAAIRELRRLHQTRNSIVHSKATIFSDGESVHIQGNDPQWIHLTPQAAREFIALPLRLAETIPPSPGILHMIGSSLRERQPRLPRVHVAEILAALELITPSQRQAVRAALDRMDADESSATTSKP